MTHRLLLTLLLVLSASIGIAVLPARAQERTADLALTLQVNRHDTVRRGQTLHYVVRVANLGPDATTVIVGNNITDSLEPIAAKCGKGGVPEGNRTCIYADVQPGVTVKSTFTAYVVDSSEYFAGNTATAYAADAVDPDLTNNAATTSQVIVNPLPFT